MQDSIKRGILFGVGVLLAIYLGWRLRTVLELVYVSALFAVVLTPVLNWIMCFRIGRWHPSRAIVIAFLMITGVSALTAFFTFALPPVLHDLRDFADSLPARGPILMDKFQASPLARHIGLPDLTARLEAGAGASASYLLTSLPGWASRVFDILTAIILTVYFMLEGEHAYHWFLSLFAAPTRRRLNKTLLAAKLRMSRWLLGQGMLMLILGSSSIAVFGILHVRYGILLGVIMGLLNIIPVAGAIVGVLLAGMVAALDSWTKMTGVFIFYALYFQLENAYLTPRIMRSSVNLMGLAVLIALLCGSTLAGVVGALVAVPTAALVAVLMDEYMVVHPWD
ncbi:MAG: AI-2E family transporter [Acidobacteriaceae bacterium]|nr:AI-2E family transporter [Acidobacteriaceae bacterium]